jgi:hypothetical protein
MASSGGYWKNLAEAQKLTQSTLVPGVIEETVKRGSLLPYFPVVQAANSGKSIKWLRESTTTEGDVAAVAVGDQLSWTETVDYTEVEVELKEAYQQKKLDKFVQAIYGNINNYEAVVLMGMKKGCGLYLGDKIFYGNATSNPKEFDGLHSLVADANNSDINIDNGETALSLMNLRKMLDGMKHGCDLLVMPFEIARRIDAVPQEAGISSYAGPWNVSFGRNELGARVTYFDGIPILRSDYLVAEQANTGLISAGRTKYSSGTKMYSIFGIKFGQVVEQEPGISLAFGGTENDGDFYKLVYFDKLENYDAQGLRLIAYVALLMGSTMAVGRITDITDAQVTV